MRKIVKRLSKDMILIRGRTKNCVARGLREKIISVKILMIGGFILPHWEFDC